MKDGNLPSAKTVTVAIAVLMVVLAAQAPAATLDPERCRVSQPRIEAQLGRGRERCGPLAEQHAPNDFETTYQACEARAIEAYAARMLRAGCDVDDGEGIEAPVLAARGSAARMGDVDGQADGGDLRGD